MQEVKITLPDGSARTFPGSVSGADVAKSISEGLFKAALAVKVDGRLADLESPITEDSKVEIITDRSPEALDVYRHSTAHLLASAVKELFPEAKIGIGPVIEDGFYYDFDRETPFTPDDLSVIENKMAEISKRAFPVERRELSWQEARDLFEKEREPYKAELAYEKGQGGPVSI